MSEADAVKLSTRRPVTRQWLVDDLQGIGVRKGMVLMVHSSLSRLGWVIGGAQTVVEALRDVLGDSGTLIMPAFTGDNSDPAMWQAPPVPEDWKDTIRAEQPAFDHLRPTRTMGAVAEYFRTLPGAIRSAHPAQSWVAIGPQAEHIIRDHSLDSGDGDDAPLGRCYEMDGYVLTLATLRTTILHLADFRTEWPGKRTKRSGSAMLVDGQRQWVAYDDHWSDGEDFEQIRQDFMAGQPAGPDTWQAANVAYGASRLFRIKPLIDFGVEWIKANRK